MVITFFALLLIFFLGILFSMLFWFWKNFKNTGENRIINVVKPSAGNQIVSGVKIASILVFTVVLFVFLIVVFFGLYSPGSWRYMMGQ